MKATFRNLLLLTISLTTLSCETEIDLISDEGDVPVVFALLDPDKPAQYLKINKTFVGEKDAQVLAKDPSSFNYKEGDIDVRLEGYLNGNREQTLRALRTEHNPKEETRANGEPGIFSTENNVLYVVNTEVDKINPTYTYQVKIDNHVTGQLVSGETAIIDDFSAGYLTNPRAAGSVSFANGRGGYFDYVFEWTSIEDAKRYEVYLQMHYREAELSGGEPGELQLIEFYLGDVVTSSTEGREKISLILKGETFYRRLNTAFSKKEPKRWFVDNFSLRFIVGGQELHTYITVNQPSEGIVQEKPEYSNVNNGLGIISSRREFIFDGIYMNPLSVDELLAGKYTRGSNLIFCSLIRNSDPPSYECE